MENIREKEACRIFEELLRVIFEFRGLDSGAMMLAAHTPVQLTTARSPSL